MAVDPSRLVPLPLFADASEDEITEAASHFSERHAEPGAHLSNEGGAGYFFFVIESGTADVSHDGEVVATLGPGDFFGEAAVLATTRRTATVTATTEMTLLEMFGADFAVLEASSPSIHALVRKALVERLS
ncbi:MAG: cyclic nucleotide-binding domain-containing protein [Acidimicrobiia bacterium]